MSIAFWSVKVTAEKSAEVQAPEGYVLNLTLAALTSGSKAQVKVSTIAIEGEPLDSVLCTLRQDKTEQFALNLVFADDVPTTFSLGSADKSAVVYLSGYFQPGPDNEEGDEDMEDFDEEDDDEDDDEEEDEDEEEVAAPAKKAAEPVKKAAEPVKKAVEPVKKAAEPVKKAAEPVKKVAAKEESSEDDEDDDEEDNDVDEAFLKVRPTANHRLCSYHANCFALNFLEDA
jgi:hypothetical protein